MMMEKDMAVLIKVDKKTKEKMRQMNINWSEEIRKFISEKLESDGDNNLALAVAISDKLFRKSKSGFNSTDFIRKMRDARYGPNRG